jgi:hypothetical protein
LDDDVFEWMEARGRWSFSGPGGVDLPAAQFSRNVLKWKQWYNVPLEGLVEEANRAVHSDFYGLITAFEPGFGSGSFYTNIPYPTDELPYVLTGFGFREMTWDPTLTVDQLRDRVRAKFFGAEAPAALTDDFCTLREIIRQAPVEAPWRQGAAAQKKGQLPQAHLSELSRISAAVDAVWPTSGPKTRESLQLMRKAIADTRHHFEVPE